MKRSMKRILVLILSVTMFFSMSSVAWADISADDGGGDAIVTYADTGGGDYDSQLQFDNTKWQLSGSVYYQIVTYCADPYDTTYENAGIYVPSAYMTQVSTSQSGNTTYYTLEVNPDGKVGDYTAETAPIVMPVNTAGYSAQDAPTGYSSNSFNSEGIIYFNAGCRGRDKTYGGAPWGATDLKAAIRYYRLNEDLLPGDTNYIFTEGHSGGGAQSSVVGASGNSSLYYEYLYEIGAAGVVKNDDGTYTSTIRDDICGAMCWCPITSLDQADEAYEWNMGQYSRDESAWTYGLSQDMAAEYAEYINSIGLVADGTDTSGDDTLNNHFSMRVDEGTVLKLDTNDFNSGTYYEYVLGAIEKSLNDFIDYYTTDSGFSYSGSSSSGGGGGDMGGGGGDMGGGPPDDEGGPPDDEGGGPGGQGGPNGTALTSADDGVATIADEDSALVEYLEGVDPNYGTADAWIVYNEDTGKYNITDIGSFVTTKKSASKSVGAFDDLGLTQAENYVLGDGADSPAHFDVTMAALMTENADKYATGSTSASTIAEYGEAYYSYINGFTDHFLGESIEYRMNMYNPMYYALNEGTSDTATNWRIHSGIQQGDTSLCVELNLALALQNSGRNVEFETVWDLGHTMAELGGDNYSTANLIAWIAECDPTDPSTLTVGTGTSSGDTGSGDTGSGDTGSGDTGSGDTGSGDTGSGDTGSGDEGGQGGDTGSGDEGGQGGDTGSGDEGGQGGDTGSGDQGGQGGDTGSQGGQGGDTGSQGGQGGDNDETLEDTTIPGPSSEEFVLVAVGADGNVCNDAIASHTWEVDSGTPGPNQQVSIDFSFEIADGWSFVYLYCDDDAAALTGPDSNGIYNLAVTLGDTAVCTVYIVVEQAEGSGGTGGDTGSQGGDEGGQGGDTGSGDTGSGDTGSGDTGSNVIDSELVLDETVEYKDGVVITSSGSVTTSKGDGYTVVMTVDGVQYDIEPETYEGDVVFTVVKMVVDGYSDHGNVNNQYMTVALSIGTDENGNNYIIEEESVLAALVGGSYDENSLDGVSITSYGESFGGVRVSGNATYTIKDLTVDFNGNGGNDFTGIGAGVAGCDNAVIEVKDSDISCKGALRSAISASDEATITVTGSDIYTESEWDDETHTIPTTPRISTAGMTNPPAGLGVYGNNRATNVVGSGTVTYDGCNIHADSWGALACDDIEATKDDPTYMTVKNCTVTVDHSGYGAYSIGYIWDMFENTTINVDEGMGVIVAAEGSVNLGSGSTINSNRLGIVTHQGMNATSNIVVDGATINAENTGILVKERASAITLNNASFNVDSGVIIQSVKNDDSGAGSAGSSDTVTVDITDSTLNGDILQSVSVPMTVTMGEGANLTGAISESTPTFANGGSAASSSTDVEGIALVGVISNNELGFVDGVSLTVVMDAGSVWTVNEDSYLTSLTINNGATLNGGIVLLDGEEITVEPGVTYEGQIEIEPAEVDKAALEEECEEDEEITAGGYTEESWANFQAALAYAEAVLADETATQVEVNNALNMLQAAKNALVPVSEEEPDEPGGDEGNVPGGDEGGDEGNVPGGDEGGDEGNVPGGDEGGDEGNVPSGDEGGDEGSVPSGDEGSVPSGDEGSDEGEEPEEHVYDFSNIEWVWADDNSSATAYVYCVNCGEPLAIEADITEAENEMGGITVTASFIYDGVEYSYAKVFDEEGNLVDEIESQASVKDDEEGGSAGTTSGGSSSGGSSSGSSTTAAKTADNSALYLYLVMILIAGAAIATVSVRRRFTR